MGPLATILSAGVWFYVLCLVVETARKVRYRDRQRRNGCQSPPGIEQSPFLFGADWVVGFYRASRNGCGLRHHRREHERFGHTFSMDLFGSTVLHTADPENIKHVLSLQFANFDLGPNRRRAFSPFLGSGIFTADGEAWSHARRSIKPRFSKQDLVSAIPGLEERTRRFLSSLPRDASVFDVQPLLFQLSMDISTEFLFGASTAGHKLPSQFSTAFEAAQAGMALRIRLGSLMDLLTSRQFRRSCSLVHRFVDEYIASSLSSSESEGEEKSFLTGMARNCSSTSQLRDHVLNLLVAGRDTTAGLMSIALFALSRHSHVWDKLQTEIAGLNGLPPGFGDLKNMKYLSWVIKETLRLWPTTPIIGRAANSDTVLPRGGGSDGTAPIFVPRGQRIALSLHAMHRQERIFGSDAAEFRPERWATFRQGWNYLPFSGGPRICVGQQFATVEASYVIVRLLQTFSRMDSGDPEPLEENLGLTLANKRGTLLSLTPRHGDHH